MPNKDIKKQKELQRKHYQNNKEKYADAQRKKRRENKKIVSDFKRGKSCVCGESHPCCLDFHHRDSKLKERVISKAMWEWGAERLKNEIEKCELICSNCHRKHHYEEMKQRGVNLLYEQ